MVNESKLTNEQIDFLKTYCPSDEHITSWNECNLITDKLALKGISTDELRSIRNSVVRLYSELRKTDSKIDYMLSMMSVTAVIDNHMYNII